MLFQPELVGLYRAKYAGSEVLFAGSLLSPEESHLSGEDVPFDPSWLEKTESRESAAPPVWLWQYFAFIAALAMLVSWLLWRERKKEA